MFKKVQYITGDFPVDLLLALERAEGERAREFQDNAQEILEGLGFKVWREYPVDNRGDGRKGRVDLVAQSGMDLYAIELDRRSPRKKSVFKVSGTQFTGGAVVIRA